MGVVGSVRNEELLVELFERPALVRLLRRQRPAHQSMDKVTNRWTEQRQRQCLTQRPRLAVGALDCRDELVHFQSQLCQSASP